MQRGEGNDDGPSSENSANLQRKYGGAGVNDDVSSSENSAHLQRKCGGGGKDGVSSSEDHAHPPAQMQRPWHDIGVQKWQGEAMFRKGVIPDTA